MDYARHEVSFAAHKTVQTPYKMFYFIGMKTFLTIYDGSVKMIRVDDILILESSKQYVDITCLYAGSVHTFSEMKTMKFFEEKLPDHFVRISRSQIVNLNRIILVKCNMIVFDHQCEVEVKNLSGLKFLYYNLSMGTKEASIGKKMMKHATTYLSVCQRKIGEYEG